MHTLPPLCPFCHGAHRVSDRCDLDPLTTVYRYAVEYVDSHGDTTRDVFRTRPEADARRRYLTERGRESRLWQV